MTLRDGFTKATLERYKRAIADALTGAHMLAFLPALALAGFWFGGELTLLLISIGLPLLFFYGGAFDRPSAGRPDRVALPDLMDTSLFRQLADRMVEAARSTNEPTACLLIELESEGSGSGLYGEAAAQHVRDQMLLRLRSGLRGQDQSVRIGDSRFGVLLQPDSRLTLETVLQAAGRLQSLLEEPVVFDRRTLYPSVSIGFCLSTRLGARSSGGDLHDAARIALEDAILNGPSALRAYSEHLRAREVRRHDLILQVPEALERGHIQPWFQPQVCTETGRISGLEALARWIHPEHGMIPPDEFLPSLEAAGLMPQLAPRMVAQGLAALKRADLDGLGIPHVSINLSASELRDPRLVERIRWELDTKRVKPERLCFEVLESVIADGPDCIISRNLRGIAAMGCRLDLDDFGTGQASLGALRAFGIHRIKIDRSFVTRIDRDPEQQRLVAAILGMCEQLGLAAVAEGVETASEHALLAQLGCNSVQGFGIARPMPAEHLAEWVRTHLARVESVPKLQRSTR